MELADLQAQLQKQSSEPPVDKWKPDFCGDMDLVIKHNGQWFYMGTPIGRQSLVNLFASVLKREGDKYFLVTPVEKVGITVEDVPFVITKWERQGEYLLLTTQTERQIIAGPEHPVELHEDKVTGDELPYVRVTRNLWARFHQNVFYQLAETGSEADIDGEHHLVEHSGSYQFSLGRL